MPAIEVSHLTKEYRLGALQGLKQTLLNTGARLMGKPVAQPPLFKALDDVSFAIEPGEVVGIIGHNGAGKSTLLKMLAGISTPTRGSVKVNGRIAPLIEVGAGFVPDFTGRENVYLNAAILGMSKREIAKKFDEIVDFAEMAEFIDTPVKRYSSGMQVKLAFAVATSIEAEILIVDEVLAVGDLAFQRKCFDRMEDLIKRKGRTVLLVSHNIRQVERLCGRTLLLQRGCLIQDDLPRAVCNHFYELMDQTAIECAASNGVASGRRVLSGDVDVIDFKTYDREGNSIESCHFGEPLSVEVTLSVHRTIRRPSIGIGVHTTDLLYLATSQSVDALPLAELMPGLHRIRFDIDCFPFVPGVYSFRVGVALGTSFQALFYAENISRILVVGRDTSRAVLSAQGEGFVVMQGGWSVTPEIAR